MAAMSPTNALVAAGISVSSRLLSAVANQLFDKPTNPFDPKNVKDHETANGFACLYVNLFSRLSGCQPNTDAGVAHSPKSKDSLNDLFFGASPYPSSVRKLTSLLREIQHNEAVITEISTDPLLDELKQTMEGAVAPSGETMRALLERQLKSLHSIPSFPITA